MNTNNEIYLDLLHNDCLQLYEALDQYNKKPNEIHFGNQVYNTLFVGYNMKNDSFVDVEAEKKKVLEGAYVLYSKLIEQIIKLAKKIVEDEEDDTLAVNMALTMAKKHKSDALVTVRKTTLFFGTKKRDIDSDIFYQEIYTFISGYITYRDYNSSRTADNKPSKS